MSRRKIWKLNISKTFSLGYILTNINRAQDHKGNIVYHLSLSQGSRREFWIVKNPEEHTLPIYKYVMDYNVILQEKRNKEEW